MSNKIRHSRKVRDICSDRIFDPFFKQNVLLTLFLQKQKKSIFSKYVCNLFKAYFVKKILKIIIFFIQIFLKTAPLLHVSVEWLYCYAGQNPSVSFFIGRCCFFSIGDGKQIDLTY